MTDETLENFISKIPNFTSLSSAAKMDFFVYYLTVVKHSLGTTAAAINECFSELRYDRYSNIPAYLKKHATKARNVKRKFIQEESQYHLERGYQAELEKQIGMVPSPPATNDYFPLAIFDNTRSHLVKIATQGCKCYDNGLYDACAVMTRKLLEVLIIETFERHKLESKIKDGRGNFFYLSDLIDTLLAETTWTIGRNARAAIPSLKKMGDQSAHNRRYFTQKADIEKIKDDLRVVLDELVHLIDYPTWNKELSAAKP
ncbi:protein of unknown function [Chitinophaga sp. YR573]|uniref:DUF4145 domain-containing protein n=1 Tax=Chitinophaga sp. YR573 TaxID=1881040 RepID=UPI0008BFED1A|nr:DUF4145 domain-containing protein [Chitinophaga sp. YR573]SEW45025.1 protein of unknown function [Chitinophaga sp. YR573]